MLLIDYGRHALPCGVRSKHRVQHGKELPHTGHKREFLRFAGGEKPSIKDLDGLVVASPDERGHVCDFEVDIGLVNGPLQRTLTGRFLNGPGGLVFFQDV